MVPTLDALQVASPLFQALVPVPAVGLGICSTCRSSAPKESAQCRECVNASAVLGPLPDVLPVSMCVALSTFHKYLRAYKDGDTVEIRRRARLRLSATLTLFIREHASCIGEFDVVTAIPSHHARTAVADLIGRFWEREICTYPCSK